MDMQYFSERESLTYHVLSLLVDAPSSFAALYGGLVRHYGYPRTMNLAALMATLHSLAQHGWITAWQMSADGHVHALHAADQERALLAYQRWLPTADLADLAVDEIGVWYEITTAGRTAWQRWDDAATPELQASWTLDQVTATQTLIIHAATEALAEAVLHWWLTTHPEIAVIRSSQRIEPVATASLRSGITIPNGVRLVVQYQPVLEPPT